MSDTFQELDNELQAFRDKSLEDAVPALQTRFEGRDEAAAVADDYQSIRNSVLRNLVRSRETAVQQILIKNYFEILRKDIARSLKASGEASFDAEQIEVLEKIAMLYLEAVQRGTEFIILLGRTKKTEDTPIAPSLELRKMDNFLKAAARFLNIPLVGEKAASFYKIKQLVFYDERDLEDRLQDVFLEIESVTSPADLLTQPQQLELLNNLRKVLNFKLLFAVDFQVNRPAIRRLIDDLKHTHFDQFFEAQFVFTKRKNLKRHVFPLIPLLPSSELEDIAQGRSRIDLALLSRSAERTNLRRIIFYYGEPHTAFTRVAIKNESKVYLFPSDAVTGPMWVESDGTLGINVAGLERNANAIIDILFGALKLTPPKMHKYIIRPEAESRSELRQDSFREFSLPSFPSVNAREALKAVQPPFGLSPNVDGVLIDAALMPFYDEQDPKHDISKSAASVWAAFLAAFQAAGKPFVILGPKASLAYERSIEELNAQLHQAGKNPVIFTRDIKEGVERLRRKVKEDAGKGRSSDWTPFAILSPGAGIEPALLKEALRDNYTYMVFEQFAKHTARIVSGLGLEAFAERLASEFFSQHRLSSSA